MPARNIRRPVARNRRNPFEFLAVALAIGLIGLVSAASIGWKSGYFAGQPVAVHAAR